MFTKYSVRFLHPFPISEKSLPLIWNHKYSYVDVFNDSANVLKNFKPNFYDLVILDIVMPDIDGLKLYKQLKKVDPDINICFLSASEKHRGALKAEGYDNDCSKICQQKADKGFIHKTIDRRL